MCIIAPLENGFLRNDYLKNNKIRDDFTAKDLGRARKILAFDKLSDEEKQEYWHRVKVRRIKDGEMSTAFLDGEIKGEAKGLAKGKAERAQLKAELKEKEEKEAELRARIALLEQQIKTPE